MRWTRTPTGCLACLQANQEIAYLREQLGRAEKREQELLDRFLAVTDRQALAALQEVRNPEPPRTWATDETGTTMMTGHGEREVLFDREGAPCVAIDGELVRVEEYDRWMQRLHQEAAGVSPGE